MMEQAKVELNAPAEVKVIARSGQAYIHKGRDAANPGAMLPVVTDAAPQKLQHFRWGLLLPADVDIHNNRKLFMASRLAAPAAVPYKFGVVRIHAFVTGDDIPNKNIRITRADGMPLYVAGVWHIWRHQLTHILIPSFGMLAVPAKHGFVYPLPYIPAFIERAHIKAWLSPASTPQKRLQLLNHALCAPQALQLTKV